MTRLLLSPLASIAALIALGAAPAFAEAGQTIQLGPPAGKTAMTIRVVTLDAAGEPNADSQKSIDALCGEGWRAGTMTVVSAPGAQPIVVAVMFTRNIPPPPPPQGGQGQPPRGLQPQPQPAPNPPPAAPLPGPVVQPSPAQQHKDGN